MEEKVSGYIWDEVLTGGHCRGTLMNQGTDSNRVISLNSLVQRKFANTKFPESIVTNKYF